jgi:hypothetical protein
MIEEGVRFQPSPGGQFSPVVDRAAVTRQFRAMAFDDYIGDAGSLRTDWIEDVLAKADVPGRGHIDVRLPIAACGQGMS